jgi:hypothetical protein
MKQEGAMRFLAFLIIASVILCLARALTLVLILVFVVSLIWALLTRPLELLGFLLIALLMEALSLSPVTTILCITGLAAIAFIRKPVEKGA